MPIDLPRIASVVASRFQVPARSRTDSIAMLPLEIQIELVRSNPNAAFGLRNTSHAMERLVLADVLRAIYHHFNESIPTVRHFVAKTIASGKTPEQIVLLADTLMARSVEAQSPRLVQMGMLSIRGHNAMSRNMMRFLCTPTVLVHAFTETFPLLSADELQQVDRLIGRGAPHNAAVPAGIEQGDVYMTALDRVILHFSATLDENEIVWLLRAQCDHAEHATLPRVHPIGGEATCEEYSLQDNVEQLGRLDTVTLALSLERYFSAPLLSQIQKVRITEDGPLYRMAFGPNRYAADRRASIRDRSHRVARDEREGQPAGLCNTDPTPIRSGRPAPAQHNHVRRPTPCVLL